jgi:hypothetical protein
MGDGGGSQSLRNSVVRFDGERGGKQNRSDAKGGRELDAR